MGRVVASLIYLVLSDLHISLYSSTVERDTVNILIDVRFILRAQTLTRFYLIGRYLDLLYASLKKNMASFFDLFTITLR